MGPALLQGYLNPPSAPGECIFAQTTACVSADLKTPITPCQFGGKPDCRQCGCMASAGLAAIGRHNVALGLKAGQIYWMSQRVGKQMRRLRANGRGRSTAAAVTSGAE